MTQRRRLQLTLIVAALLALPLQASAQLEPNLGGLTDDNAKGYLKALPTAFSGTLNSTIFSSGSVPRMGINFEFGVKVMGVTFGDESRYYTPSDPPGFQSTSPGTRVPSVVGDTGAVAVPGQGGTVMYYPGGFDIDKFTLAVPQLSIGSVMGTRAVVRWIALHVSDDEFGQVRLFGAGLQHSVSQYLPGLPVDIAAGAFYQKFEIGDGMVDSKAMHVGVTASKTFAMFQPYATIGYDTLEMEAKYQSDTDGTDVNVNFDKQSKMRFAVGASASIAFLKLNGEFTAAAENGVAVGLGFGN
jgi:hypothetical protein